MMQKPPAPPRPDPLPPGSPFGASPVSGPPRLRQRRFLARAAILFEAVWPAVWPALGVAGLFLIAALLNLPMLLPPSWHLVLVIVVGLVILGLLVAGLWRVRVPTQRLADRRLETDSGLRHQPLSVLSDRPATTDALGLALWQAHAARAAGQIGRLRVGLPRPGLPRRDRHALRHAVVLGLVAALAIAGTEAPARVWAALSPSLPAGAGAPPPELQAWITPPAYTHVAPLFLKAGSGAVSVPAGSRLTINVSGITDAPSAVLNDRQVSFTALDNHSFQTEMDLAHGGLLRVRHDGEEMAAWPLTVVADQPPTAAWGDNPGASRDNQQTRLPWVAADDYGVTGLQAELRLKQRPEAPPVVVNILLPGGTPRQAHGVDLQDLTAHPWAGLAVIGKLVAHDAAGQSGSSGEANFVLGERPFHNPVAQVLIAARKTLSLHPSDRTEALGILDQLLQRPALFKNDAAAFMLLSTTYYLLTDNHAAAAVPEAQDRLWQLALHMEEGQSEQTAQALEQARRAARDAMDKAQQQPNEANRKALEQRLQQLQQAIQQHMQALQQQAMRNNDIQPFNPEAARLSTQQMQQLTRQAEQAAREGRMADAEQQMSQLERMLDQLRNAHSRQGDSQRANSRQQRGRNQASVVQDLIAREGGLLDHAQQRGTASAGMPPNGDAQRQADARMQGALRGALGELMQQFTDLSGEASQGLGDADQAMSHAVTRLQQGDDAAAGDALQQAIEALQKGNKEMGQAMAKLGKQPGQKGETQSGQDQGSEGQGSDGDDQDGDGGLMGMMAPGNGQGDGNGNGTLPGSPDQSESGNRDPLGRQMQGAATDNDEVVVPEQRERQRTQAIEEELRRRGADQERPRQELDYIDRLLQQF